MPEFFIRPNGVDTIAGSGGSSSAPWKTWAFAFANSNPGDTLTVLDGTFTPSVNGNPVLTKVCTASTVYTVRALNQRVPLIAGTGATNAFKVLNSSYVTIDGLRVRGADLAAGSGGTATETVSIQSSTHVTWKNSIVSRNNRYFNVHLIIIRGTVGGTDVGNNLVEDTELYEFHRHGLILYYSDFNTVRRLYGHSRSYDDIPGGSASLTVGQGESLVAIYPASNNIVENCIAENVLGLAEVNASARNTDNKFYGNIVLGTRASGTSSYRGIVLDSRGDTATLQVRNTVIKDFVAIDLGDPTAFSNIAGVFSLSTFNTQVINATVINAEQYGYWVFKGTDTGGGVYSFSCTNCLAISNDTKGFFITPDIQTWSVTNGNAFSNGVNYDPATSANYTPVNPPSAVDPQMGSCYLWRPDGSAAKTNNWGADILYRYVDGTLTTTPLWDSVTGEFTHGAVIAGVNDIVGQSLFDVQKRLHVPYPGSTHGCAFPASYGGGAPPPDTTPPAAPTGLTVQ